VAREFQAALGADITFLTTPKAVTAQILERYQIPWQAISSRALLGQGRLARLRTYFSLPGHIREAREILKKLAPHLVLGVGGHAAGPVGGAAWSLKIPLAIHEQNAVPGFTNRWLGRLASRIFLSFPDSQGSFPAERSLWVGNPIREEFLAPPPPRPEQPFTVLIMGGSQGAHHLNMETLAALNWLGDYKDRLHFIHLTGQADREHVGLCYYRAGFTSEVWDFSDQVPDFMARAHLIVCRAGASTLAELTALGRAALLVPYPFAANNHQEANARFLESKGAAQVILNKEFTGEVLAAKIRHLLATPETLPAMEAASLSLAKPRAAQEIVAGCRELVEKEK
jgi:UDP-N-acetylglucosamine--N-acetylmuramyl-(pentapeptide) pyrophosphoryl-undecaprenol N-acetylglucosamine transferase